MAQIKKDVYFVVEAKENAETGVITHDVFDFTDTESADALSLAQKKYFDLLSADWDNDTYDYLAVDIIRMADNVCVKADYRDSREEPIPVIDSDIEPIEP